MVLIAATLAMLEYILFELAKANPTLVDQMEIHVYRSANLDCLSE